jgi:hypothetical protein
MESRRLGDRLHADTAGGWWIVDHECRREWQTKADKTTVSKSEIRISKLTKKVIVIPARQRAETPHFGVQARLQRESRKGYLWQ